MNLKRTSLEIAKIDKKGIDAFLEDITQRGIELHDFYLLRGEYVCYEASFMPYKNTDLHMLYSLSKAFTAIGIGFALSEGLLHLEDTLYSYFKEDLTTYFDKKMPTDNFSNPIGEKAKRITIEHMLTMNTGQEEEPPILNYEFEGNWIAKFLQIEPVHEPGSFFFYDTTATYCLSALITKVTGQTLADYLVPRFFAPLGIEDYAWDNSPAGCSLGGIGLNLSIESIAKLGVFLLQEGNFNGKQLLDAAYLKRMTSNLVASIGGDVYDNGNNWGVGYGYQIWQCIPDGYYRGDGAFGQFAIVSPKDNLIIATLSGTEDMGGLMDSMWKYLLPACAPIDVATLTEAASTKETFTVPVLEGSDILPVSLPAIFTVVPNEENIESLRFNMSEKKVLSITCYFQDGKDHTLNFGYKAFEDNRIPGQKYANYYTCGDITTSNTAGCYAFFDNALYLKLCHLNGPLGILATCRFTDDGLTIDVSKARSMSPKTSYHFETERKPSA
ncbi:MAG: serine hydrolase domain-containing protein [Lachnospiraceae bacterium]